MSVSGEDDGGDDDNDGHRHGDGVLEFADHRPEIYTHDHKTD